MTDISIMAAAEQEGSPRTSDTEGEEEGERRLPEEGGDAGAIRSEEDVKELIRELHPAIKGDHRVKVTVRFEYSVKQEGLAGDDGKRMPSSHTRRQLPRMIAAMVPKYSVYFALGLAKEILDTGLGNLTKDFVVRSDAALKKYLLKHIPGTQARGSWDTPMTVIRYMSMKMEACEVPLTPGKDLDNVLSKYDFMQQTEGCLSNLADFQTFFRKVCVDEARRKRTRDVESQAARDRERAQVPREYVL